MGDYNDAFMRNPNAGVEARPKVQNRTNVLQLKLIGQSHPTGLTSNLLKLFEPRPPLEFKPPPEKRKCPSYTGIAHFVNHFAEPGDPEYAPPVPKVETPAEKRARIHTTRLEKGAEKVAEDFKNYDPNNDPNASGDPYKTLFVARINYETSESKIKREFESYGPIKRVQLVTDKETSKPKGYAFIEYVHTRDMKAAYKQGDGRKIDGKRVLVDVERGRTVPNWRPRRLGGGLGTSRVGSDDTVRDQEPQRTSRSQEPRVLEERDREKSRERVKEKDREKSRERSRDRPRDRDREDRHHRDRDRARDGDREKDRSHRDRDRDRRDRDRTRDHGRDRDHHRDRDYDHERRRSRDKEPEYERAGSKHRHEDKDYDHVEQNDHDRGYYDERKYSEIEPDRYEQYDRDYGQGGDQDRYDEFAERDHGRYDQMDAEDDYRYERGASDRGYRRSERSISREYDH